MEYGSLQIDTKGMRLADISMALGIATLFTTFTFPIIMPAILGSVSIVLAILSRGGGKYLSSHARIGFVLSAVGLIIAAVLVIMVAWAMVQITVDPEFKSQFIETFINMYGYSPEQLLESLQ